MSPRLRRNIEARASSLALIAVLVIAGLSSIFLIPESPLNGSASALRVGNTAEGTNLTYITYNNYKFMRGVWVEANATGYMTSICVQFGSVIGDASFQCGVYTFVDNTTNFAGARINTTKYKSVLGADDNKWITFDFNASQRPTVVSGTKYYICIRPTAHYSSSTSIKFTNNWPAHTAALDHSARIYNSGSTGYYKFNATMTGESGDPDKGYYCMYANVTTTTEISNVEPTDGSPDVVLQPRCNVTVSEANGRAMNITWASNYSDGITWVNYQTNTSVFNGTYKYDFTGANTEATTYYWRVYANNSLTNISEDYSFTTLLSGGGVYEIAGLNPTTDFTWKGDPGRSVWANDSSDSTYAETLRIYTNASADNCTAIYIDFSNFTSTLFYRNISIEVRNAADGVWNKAVHQVIESDGNVTLNSAMWAGAGWCHGTNPFPIVGANKLIEVRAMLTIPTTAASATYVNSGDWKVIWRTD